MGGPYNAFNGIIDGDNHKIMNITINGGSYEGIFGYVGGNATIKNITIENLNIPKSSTYIGTISGRINSGANLKNIKIKNTTIEANGSYIGGISGYETSGSGTVILDEDSGLEIDGLEITGTGSKVGGLFGYTAGKIIKQFNNFKGIKIEGSGDIGGFVGVGGPTIETIEENDQIEVTGTGMDVGGLTGSSGTVREVKINLKVTNLGTGSMPFTGGIAGEGTTIRGVIGRIEFNGTGRYKGTILGIRGSVNGVIIESGSSTTGFQIEYTSPKNVYYFGDYVSRSYSGGTLWPDSYKNDLEQYSTIVDTPLTGDTNNTGYIFDYVLGDGQIHLVPVQQYTGWKLMNNKTPMLNQKWSYFDDNTHERITSGWHELYDLYNNLQWYYFENSNAKTGWLEDDGKKYYLSTFDPDGNGYIDCNRIHDASIMIDEVLYTFDSDGVCTNCN